MRETVCSFLFRSRFQVGYIVLLHPCDALLLSLGGTVRWVLFTYRMPELRHRNDFSAPAVGERLGPQGQVLRRVVSNSGHGGNSSFYTVSIVPMLVFFLAFSSARRSATIIGHVGSKYDNQSIKLMYLTRQKRRLIRHGRWR